MIPFLSSIPKEKDERVRAFALNFLKEEAANVQCDRYVCVYIYMYVCVCVYIYI